MKRLNLLVAASLAALAVGCSNGDFTLKKSYEAKAVCQFTEMAKSGNFHEIEKGRAYRSAQLPATSKGAEKGGCPSLEDVIKEYGIRSVINLRGVHKDERWYQEEVSVCKDYGIGHYSVRIYGNRLPEKEELLKVFEVLDNAEYPILAHCEHGLVRAGFFSTIYKLQYQKKSLEEALKQLDFVSPEYRQKGGVRSIEDFFKLYKEFGKGRDIHTWVEEDYEYDKYKGYFSEENFPKKL